MPVIEGKWVTLETEDEVKGQTIVNYMDWILETNKEEIAKKAVDMWFEGGCVI